MRRISTKIRELLAAKHWTQEDLADITQINRTDISNIMRGVRWLSASNAMKMGAAFSVDPIELLMVQTQDKLDAVKPKAVRVPAHLIIRAEICKWMFAPAGAPK